MGASGADAASLLASLVDMALRLGAAAGAGRLDEGPGRRRWRGAGHQARDRTFGALLPANTKSAGATVTHPIDIRSGSRLPGLPRLFPHPGAGATSRDPEQVTPHVEHAPGGPGPQESEVGLLHEVVHIGAGGKTGMQPCPEQGLVGLDFRAEPSGEGEGGGLRRGGPGLIHGWIDWHSTRVSTSPVLSGPGREAAEVTRHSPSAWAMEGRAGSSAS